MLHTIKFIVLGLGIVTLVLVGAYDAHADDHKIPSLDVSVQTPIQYSLDEGVEYQSQKTGEKDASLHLFVKDLERQDTAERYSIMNNSSFLNDITPAAGVKVHLKF